MLDELSMHLSQTAGPELQAAIEEACGFFDRFELPEWQDRYTELMMTLDNSEMGEHTQAIAQLTSNLQRVLLTNFQITLLDEVSIVQANLIIRTLDALETTELVDEVKTICGEENDPVEAFAALMVLMVQDPYHTAETYHAYLADVGQALINTINAQIHARVPDQAEDEVIDVERDQQLVQDLTTFMTNMGLQGVMIHSLIHEGLKLGIPFESYYEKIIPFLAPTEAAKTATELFAAFLVSAEREKDPRTVVGQALQHTYSTLDVITPIMVALEGVVLKAHITKTSGVRKA